MSSYSRHSDKARHSGSDYSRSSRSSHSSKRSEDSLKRRKERDRHYERRKERRRSPERSSDRKYPRREESRFPLKESRNHDISKEESKLSRSRSKADRTYNTDTEESDESFVSLGRFLKRRHSSDHDDDKHQSDRKDDEEVASNRISSNQLSTKRKEAHCFNSKDVERNRKTDFSEHKSINPALSTHEKNDLKSTGPSLPPRKGSPVKSEDKSSSVGPILPPHLERKGSQVDSEDESNPFGPILPPHLQRKDSPVDSEDESNPVGAILPPHLQRKGSPVDSEDESNSVGPILPPHLQRKSLPDSSKGGSSLGPILPPHHQRKGLSEESASVGPVPPYGRGKGSLDSKEEHVSIGPVLPPHLKKKGSSDNEEERVSIGPALPTDQKSDSEDNDSRDIGPVLPPNLQQRNSSESQEESATFGPALPPGLQGNSSRRILGPSLPPGIILQDVSNSEDSEDEVIGPMLPEELIQSNKNYLVHAQFERRAAEMKRKLEEKGMGPEVTKREQWMLELPPENTIDFGLRARTFRVKGAPEKGADRSMWTDTPADKLRKLEQAVIDAQCEGSSRSAEVPPEISQRDKEMDRIVKKHSKKRGKESLLDLHQKELKKKKKKDKDVGKKVERRPFSREIDLKTNVFDEAQKKSIFKKAQLLDTRFSTGETKYL